MNDQRKRTILSVIGMLALLIACVIGVQAVFAGLGAAFPQKDVSLQGDGSQSQAAQEQDMPEDAGDGSDRPAPSFCPFCGEGLPSSFRWGQYCPYCGEQVEA